MTLIGKIAEEWERQYFYRRQELSPGHETKLRKDKEEYNHEISKTFNETMVKGAIGDKSHLTEAKKISYMKKERKTEKKDGYQSNNRYRRKSNRNSQCQKLMEH